MKKFDELMSVSNNIENISAEQAKKKLNDPNVQFIDVRDKESFSKGTIGNAIHMDRGLLEFYLADGSPLENDIFKKNPDKEYVVFCGLGGQGPLDETFQSRLDCFTLSLHLVNVSTKAGAFVDNLIPTHAENLVFFVKL